jgi:hypothetical protein
MVLGQPVAVVAEAHVPDGGRVQYLNGPLEAPPRADVPARGASVLLEDVVGIEAGLEVGRAQQGGAVAPVLGQPRRHRRGVGGQGHAVGHHAVGAHVLAGEHGGAGRHADGVLVVGPLVADALGGQAVDHGRAGDAPTVAPEGVVALLVGGDEEDVPLTRHRPCPSARRR